MHIGQSPGNSLEQSFQRSSLNGVVKTVLTSLRKHVWQYVGKLTWGLMSRILIGAPSCRFGWLPMWLTLISSPSRGPADITGSKPVCTPTIVSIDYPVCPKPPINHIVSKDYLAWPKAPGKQTLLSDRIFWGFRDKLLGQRVKHFCGQD